MSRPQPPSPRRLDPDLAAQAAARRATRRRPPPVVDTRRYQRMIGLLGIAAGAGHLDLLPDHARPRHRRDPGRQEAPLLRRAAGDNEPQRRRQHESALHRWPSTIRGRSTSACCAKRAPLVLAFFVTRLERLREPGNRAADGLARVQAEPGAVRRGGGPHRPRRRAQGGRLSTIGRSPSRTTRTARSATSTASRYARSSSSRGTGGVVANRLIGDHWASAATLGPQVRALVNGSS